MAFPRALLSVLTGILDAGRIENGPLLRNGCAPVAFAIGCGPYLADRNFAERTISLRTVTFAWSGHSIGYRHGMPLNKNRR